MIPNLAEVAVRLSVSPAVVPLAFAALFTAIVLFVQSFARWFEERNPQQK